MAGRGSVLPSVIQKSFAKIPAPNLQRSVFNRSRGWKGTFNGGDLIPFYVDEILPGDTVNLKAQIFARLQTLKFPIMDNVHVDMFWFFAPNRILWNNWQKFQGEQVDPGDSIDFEVPVLGEIEPGAGLSFSVGDLADYFGIPISTTIVQADAPISLPFRMYRLVWNTWFRDQNLQDSQPVPLDDGPDDTTDLPLTVLKRGKRHDYFTSCLPWPQKGDGISIPLGTTAPVIGNGTTIGFVSGGGTGGGLYAPATSEALKIRTDLLGDPVGTGIGGGVNFDGNEGIGLHTLAANSGMIADLAGATAATINQLREAFAFQQILERDARGGTRYIEILKSHFGVTVPDFRLQRPEYLGGGSQRVSVNAVAQTTYQGTETMEDAKGSLAAYTQVTGSSGFMKTFDEHGYIIGLVNVRADLSYQQGMHRMWSRRTRYDFYMPLLAHLGEQAVYNKEIFYATGGATANSVFGYQERWAEYRYGQSQITGKFRSDAAGTLDVWHLAIDFSALPVLNDSFIQDNPPLERVVGVTTEPEVLMDAYFDVKHARVMPIYSVPGLERL